MGPLTFYFDRNFGKRFPEALVTVKPPFVVEYHHSQKNNFPQNMPDDQWLEICGTKKWIAFSHDKKFDRVPIEAAAIKTHAVAAFALCGASLDSWHKLKYFVQAHKRIAEILSIETPPFFYRITHGMQFQQVTL